jgi:hypothetical protein
MGFCDNSTAGQSAPVKSRAMASRYQRAVISGDVPEGRR